MNKKVILVVEPQRKALNKIFSVIKKPSRKYAGVTIISFPNYEVLGRVLTGARLELMATIRNSKPKSIQDLARILKKDFKNVYKDVKIMAEFGLIEVRSRGPRKSAELRSIFTELILAA